MISLVFKESSNQIKFYGCFEYFVLLTAHTQHCIMDLCCLTAFVRVKYCPKFHNKTNDRCQLCKIVAFDYHKCIRFTNIIYIFIYYIYILKSTSITHTYTPRSFQSVARAFTPDIANTLYQLPIHSLWIQGYRKISNIRRTKIPALKLFSSHLADVSGQSIEARG